MNLTHLVTNLELSKRLKYLGVRQESVFYWCNLYQGEKFHTEEGLWRIIFGTDGWVTDSIVSAFTAGELGEMLPHKSKIKEATVVGNWWRDTELYITKSDTKWHVRYINVNTGIKSISFIYENEADARAAMLIFLIENGLISVKK